MREHGLARWLVMAMLAPERSASLRNEGNVQTERLTMDDRGEGSTMRGCGEVMRCQKRIEARQSAGESEMRWVDDEKVLW